MIKKLIIAFMLLFSSCAYADQVTTFYKLIIPDESSFDWHVKFSNDVITLDTVLGNISADAVTYSNATKNVDLGTKTFGAGTITITGLDNVLDASFGSVTYPGILSVGYNNEVWVDGNVGGENTLNINYRGEDAGLTQYRDFKVYSGRGGNPLLTVDGSMNYVIIGTSGMGTLGIGTTTPIVSMDVAGQISCDAVRFDIQTSSPDTATLKGPCLFVSQDTSGVRTLNFYDGTNWHRIAP